MPGVRPLKARQAAFVCTVPKEAAQFSALGPYPP
jgi:hypothetical protein